MSQVENPQNDAMQLAEDVAQELPHANSVKVRPAPVEIRSIYDFKKIKFISQKETPTVGKSILVRDCYFFLEGGFVRVKHERNVVNSKGDTFAINSFQFILDPASIQLLTQVHQTMEEHFKSAGVQVYKLVNPEKGNNYFVERVGMPLTKYNGFQVRNMGELIQLQQEGKLDKRRCKLVVKTRNVQVFNTAKKDPNTTCVKLDLELAQLAISAEPYASPQFLI